MSELGDLLVTLNREITRMYELTDGVEAGYFNRDFIEGRSSGLKFALIEIKKALRKASQ